MVQKREAGPPAGSRSHGRTRRRHGDAALSSDRVCGRALDDIVVVGLSGTTAHFDGRRWSRRATGTTANVPGVAPLDGTRWRAAWVARDGTTDAVGDGGTVRKRLP